MSSELETNIRQALGDNDVSPNGFHTCYCKVCNDTKRKRAGFKFTDDSIIYNCFRSSCPATSVYEYGKGMSKRFKKVLHAFDVDIPLDILTAQRKTYQKVLDSLDETLYEKHSYDRLTLPDDFEPLDKFKHKVYIDYLNKRKIDIDQEFYVGHIGQWAYKLIIPFYYYDKLIGWQGVDIMTGKYLKSSENTDMIYLPTGKMPNFPIIVEGIFDAMSIPNAIAILQNHVSKKQAFMLRNKDPILLPDRRGSHFIDSMKLYKWKMCVPEWHYKDVNAAVQKLGRLIVARMIHNGLSNNPVTAEVKFNMWRIQ